MMELLAPAGSREALMAAVSCGADAVYLGGKGFNARASADNFDDLDWAASYCTLRGVKVYLVLNTLVKEGEMEDALALARRGVEAGVSAMILQDLGLAAQIKGHCPGLPLHASTQMGIHHPDALAPLRDMGFSRAILSREVSLPDIAVMARQPGMEIEVFVHGALCVGFSGQCLMSSQLGGRSGNRGRCAQPCRLPWSYGKAGEGYGLNTRDICLIRDLAALQKAGVRSLKIEGRLRRPAYVAVVVDAYRRALDALMEGGEFTLTPEDEKQLQLAYHRGGFSRGYTFGLQESELIDPVRSNHGGVLAGRVLGPGRVEWLDTDLTQGDGLEIRDARGRGDRGGMVVGPMDAGSKMTPLRLPPGVRSGDTLWRTSSKRQDAWTEERIRQGRRISVDLHARLALGSPLQLTLSDGERSVEVAGDTPATPARKRPLDGDTLKGRLLRLGDSIYQPNSVAIDLDDGLFLPLVEINETRRRAVEALDALRWSQGRPRYTWMESPATTGQGFPCPSAGEGDTQRGQGLLSDPPEGDTIAQDGAHATHEKVFRQGGEPTVSLPGTRNPISSPAAGDGGHAAHALASPHGQPTHPIPGDASHTAPYAADDRGCTSQEEASRPGQPAPFHHRGASYTAPYAADDRGCTSQEEASQPGQPAPFRHRGASRLPLLAVQVMTAGQAQAAARAGADEILLQPALFNREVLEDMARVCFETPHYAILPVITFREGLNALKLPNSLSGVYISGINALKYANSYVNQSTGAPGITTDNEIDPRNFDSRSPAARALPTGDTTTLCSAAIPGCTTQPASAAPVAIGYYQFLRTCIHLNDALNKSVRGDMGWNVMNRASLGLQARLGMERATLSPELTLVEMNALATGFPCEVIVYGRLPLMQLVHCPRRASGISCPPGGCTQLGTMYDRRREAFPVKSIRLGSCTHQLLNAHVLHLAPHIGKIQGMEALRLLMAEETPDQVEAIVKGYRRAMEGEDFAWPWPEIKVTAGHAFRGIL